MYRVDRLRPEPAERPDGFRHPVIRPDRPCVVGVPQQRGVRLKKQATHGAIDAGGRVSQQPAGERPPRSRMRQTSLIGLEQPPDQVVKGVLATYYAAFRVIGISVG